MKKLLSIAALSLVVSASAMAGSWSINQLGTATVMNNKYEFNKFAVAAYDMDNNTVYFGRAMNKNDKFDTCYSGIKTQLFVDSQLVTFSQSFDSDVYGCYYHPVSDKAKKFILKEFINKNRVVWNGRVLSAKGFIKTVDKSWSYQKNAI